MATAGISSFGTLLQVGDGDPTETFTTIAEVKDIRGPKIKQNSEEATNHSSPNGWEEFVGHTKGGGTVVFDVNFVPTGATHDASTGLLADLVAGTLRNFQLVFPDSGSTTWAFAALVQDFEPGAPVKGILTASITLQISGEPTLA